MIKRIVFIIAILAPSVALSQATPPRFHGGVTDQNETTFVDVLNDGSNDRIASDSIVKARDPQGVLIEKKESGIVDSASSTTPLGADGIFESPWVDAKGFTNLAVVVFADQPSAIDGLEILLSSDGVNTDVSDTYTIKANIGEQYTVGLTARFFKIRYQNTSSAQSIFRIQSFLHVGSPKPSSHRIDDSIDGENDAELVKAVITAENSNNQFVNKRAGSEVDSNSSTTPLGSGATFTGDFFDLIGYGGFTVFIETDQDGTLFIDTSTDGVNFVSRQFDVSAGMEFVNGFSPSTKFARVRYTNGATAQTVFRLQTITYIQQLSPSSQPINTNLNVNTIATNTRAIMAGQREDGAFDNVDLSNSSSLKVAVTDRPSEVRGRVQVHIPVTRTALTGTPTVLYTVTAGKTLFIHSFSFTSLNDSGQVGEWRLRDSTTVKSAKILAQRVTGVPAQGSSTSPSLPEPVTFTTDVNAIEISGDVEISGFLIGYEE